MLNKFISCLLLLASWTTVCGQTYEYKLAASVNDFADNARCIITTVKSGGVCNLFLEKDNRSEAGNIYDFKHDKVYRDIEDMTGRTQVFQLKKTDGHFYLFVPDKNAYVSLVDKTMTTNSALFYLFALTPNAKDSVYMEKNNGAAEIKIGNRYLRHHQTASSYRLVTNISTTYETVQLYIEHEKGEDPVLELTPETDLTNTNFTGTIKFNRTFENNYHNTIVLPFTIDDPWKVFGSGVIIYEPQNGTASELTFRKMEKGEKMTGYKPYLISGTFDSAPYIIPNVTLNYKTIGTKLKTTVGGLVLHSVFQKSKMGQTANYILFKDKFRSCKTVKSLNIEPYKWYIMPPGTSAKSVKWTESIHLNLSR